MTTHTDGPEVCPHVAELEECVVLQSRGQTDLLLWSTWSKRRGGAVLELGTGTGRVLSFLLRQGLDAYGIEVDPQVRDIGLARLAHQGIERPESRLLLGDIRHFDIGRRFSLVIVPFNTFGLLADDDLRSTLACVAQHLELGGTLAIEAQTWPGERCPFPWMSKRSRVGLETRHGTFVYSEVARQPLPNAPLTVERSYEAPDGTLYEYSFERKVRLLPEWDELAGSMGFVRVSPAVDQSGNPWTAKSKMVFFEIALNRLT